MNLILLSLSTSLWATVINWKQPPLQISSTANKSPTQYTCIATDGNTTVMAAWAQNGFIYGASYNVGTQTWNSSDQISPDDGNAVPHIVIVGTNQAVITWIGSTDLWAVTYGPGHTVLPPVRLAHNAAADDTAYSIVPYYPGDGSTHVIAAFIDNSNPQVNLVDFNVTTQAITAPFIPITSATAPFNNNQQPQNAFITVQPTTNVILLAFSANGIDGNDIALGVQVPYPLQLPQMNSYTVFRPDEFGDFRVGDIPQIQFNRGDNQPYFFWATTLGSKSNPPQILGTQWTNYLASSHTGSAPVTITAYNIISSTVPLSTDNPLPFFVAPNKQDYFSLIYRQNSSATTPLAQNFVYGASYIPGLDSPANDQISVSPAGADATQGYLGIQNICSSDATTVRNAIIWIEGIATSSSFINGAVYTPGSAPTEITKLSTPSISIPFLDDNFNTLGLILASQGQQLVGIWNQFLTDSQAFATSGILNCPSAPTPTPTVGTPLQVTVTQELRQLPLACYLVNIINMQSTGSTSSYQIYLQQDLTNPLATIPATNNQGVFYHCNRQSTTPDIYYVYALDASGNRTGPVVITVPS